MALSDRVKGHYDLKINSKCFLLLAGTNGLKHNRLGVTVSKKIGNAVCRNRIKRVVREFFRLNNSQWPQGFDYLFIARSTAGAFAYTSIKNDLTGIIDQKLVKKSQHNHLNGATEHSSRRMLSSEEKLKAELAMAASFVGRILSTLALFLIRIYQRGISPFLPPACRFSPTCSAYGVEAISRHGFWRGSYLTARRLLRCHPFHSGGYDPVPPIKVRKS